MNLCFIYNQSVDIFTEINHSGAENEGPTAQIFEACHNPWLCAVWRCQCIPEVASQQPFPSQWPEPRGMIHISLSILPRFVFIMPESILLIQLKCIFIVKLKSFNLWHIDGTDTPSCFCWLQQYWDYKTSSRLARTWESGNGGHEYGTLRVFKLALLLYFLQETKHFYWLAYAPSSY